jgi:formamidopyrimidine-DNA glycosylase
MPSLPELEVYKRDLKSLIGRTITRVEPLDYRVVHAPIADLEHVLIGRTITRIDRYGKWLIFSTGATEQLILHLGLTGKLSFPSPDSPDPKSAAFAITTDDGRRLLMRDQRHLGKVYVRQFADLKSEKLLGPDLLDIDERYFTGTLRRKRWGARDVLMDQHIIAGIGGKYADEILWQARLHPNTKLDRLTESELSKLYHLTRRIHEQAIALDGNVEQFPDDWLIPHRRTDQTCPRCHGPLHERKLGGSSTYYCPHCQVPPNPSRRG